MLSFFLCVHRERPHRDRGHLPATRGSTSTPPTVAEIKDSGSQNVRVLISAVWASRYVRLIPRHGEGLFQGSLLIFSIYVSLLYPDHTVLMIVVLK